MVDMHYVKSWAGLLKIGEFFCLLVAFSSLVHFTNDSENNSSFKFFIAMTIISWLAVILLFVLFASELHEKVTINWTIAMLVFSVGEVAILLIANSVAAEKARQLRRDTTKTSKGNYYDTCDLYKEHAVPCSNVEAAVVFGFLALALFLADATFYFFKYRSASEPNDNGFIQDEAVTATSDTNPNSVDQIP